MDTKLKRMIEKIKKEDPMYSCRTYLEVGCSHIDGMLCHFPKCNINNNYINDMKRLESFENEFLEMSNRDIRYESVRDEICKIKKRYGIE